MKQIAYKTLVGIFMSFFLFGQTITVDAPRVVLKNIEFNISYSVYFFNSDSLIMRVNGAIIQASNLSNDAAVPVPLADPAVPLPAKVDTSGVTDKVVATVIMGATAS